VYELFEAYIDRQFALFTDAHLLPAITYKDGRQTVQAAEWTVVFDNLVLLVEVKAEVPGVESGLGVLEGGQDPPVAPVCDRTGSAACSASPSAASASTVAGDLQARQNVLGLGQLRLFGRPRARRMRALWPLMLAGDRCYSPSGLACHSSNLT
jgi:hypothetical protein